MVAAAADTLNRTALEAVEAAATTAAPTTWRALPEAGRCRVRALAQAQISAVIENVIHDMQAQVGRAATKDGAAASNADEANRLPHDASSASNASSGGLFNLERLVVSFFIERPAMVSAMFITTGFSELVFIRDLGAVMGGVLGLVQMGVYAGVRGPWLLPTFGLVAGALTNWLAMSFIFYPFEPWPLCPRWCCAGGEGKRQCIVQGRFIRRQPQVAATYANIVATAIITPRRVLDDLVYDGVSLRAICRRRTLEATEHAIEHAQGQLADASPRAASWLGWLRVVAAGMGSPTPMAAGGASVEDAWEAARERAAEVVLARLPEVLMQWEGYLAEAMDLERTIRDRMAALPPHIFETLLHSIFQEDEWKLIAVGGLLGALLGGGQAYGFHLLGLAG